MIGKRVGDVAPPVLLVTATLRRFLAPFRLFNSVPFGIALLVLTAGYIAVGSGLPSVRRALEMNEMQFFNWWPLKLLMGLLVVTLATVTLIRIPLTPPRYGVWCVHAGIILLILGMAAYFRFKIEGLALVPRGGVATAFYDTTERSLFARIDDVTVADWPLPNLPRYGTYTAAEGRSIPGAPGALGLSYGDELRVAELRIVGFYAHARIGWMESDPRDAREARDAQVGVELMFKNPQTGDWGGKRVLVSERLEQEARELGLDVEHRHLPQDAAALRDSAAHLHHLDVMVGGKAPAALDVEPGRQYPAGDYRIEVEQYIPTFPLTSGQIASCLMLKITSPTQTFRRQVIEGTDLQTDFKLDDPAAGPIGKRQKTPLDEQLVIRYRKQDPWLLLPTSEQRHVLVTSDANPGVLDITTAVDRPTEVRVLESGRGQIAIATAGTTLDVRVRRAMWEQRAQELPRTRWARTDAEAAAEQVVEVEIRRGNWTKRVLVPFEQFAMEQGAWTRPVALPGTERAMRLKFGNTRRPLPARIGLEKFELVSFPGGGPASGMQRDFRSTLRIDDGREAKTATIKLNEPHYFTDPGGWSWLIFQASWDQAGEASGQGAQWTVLGIGNRVGVNVMIAGSAMIVLGVLYAFYLKPVIIRRMKAKALAAHAARIARVERERTIAEETKA